MRVTMNTNVLAARWALKTLHLDDSRIPAVPDAQMGQYGIERWAEAVARLLAYDPKSRAGALSTLMGGDPTYFIEMIRVADMPLDALVACAAIQRKEDATLP